MFERKRVLVLIDWFAPGFKGGGPIRSAANLISVLSDKIDFSIVTRNTDLSDAGAARTQPYQEVPSDVWIEWKKGAEIIYLSDNKINNGELRRILQTRKYDYLYVNSLFSVRFAILPLLIAALQKRRDFQVIVAPRGSLQDGALAQKKFKKLVFLQLFKRLPLTRRIIWHATDAQEQTDIKRQFGANSLVRLAPNLPEQLQHDWSETRKTPGAARFYFASRVSPKKNLEFFLERLSNARGAIEFDVYGALENAAYLMKCKRLAACLPSNVCVEFKGALPPERLRAAVRDYHFSVLTTHGENFGHSIFEALLAGKPVILSDKTPWRELERRNLGWDLALENAAAFERVVEQCVNMNQIEYNKWSLAAWSFAREYKSAPALIQQARRLFV